nr:MlrC C-terminal domain-containing protein [bacterium]
NAEKYPVVISDSGDNPTAGGVGDSAYVLSRLLAHRVNHALVAGIADAVAVEACHTGGLGATISLSLGGTLAPSLSRPVMVTAEVMALTEDVAVIHTRGIDVIVTRQRKPFHYRSDFELLGIDPADYRIIAIKLGYLVPEISALAGTSLLALSPGAVNQDIVSLTYTRLKRPMYPFDN